MKVQTVLPYVVQEWMAACVQDCRLNDVCLVDNTVRNRGIMRSHNIGRRLALEGGADWLLVLSAAVRFGAPGGLDFVFQLEDVDATMVSARGVFGWHMIAFRRDLLEAVGQWDENYSPYSLDDVDYAIRAWKASELLGRPELRRWATINVDVTDAGMGHSHKIGGVHVRNEAVMEYFARKWGRPQGGEWHEYNDHPFVQKTDGLLPDARPSIDWWPTFAHHYELMGSDVEIVGRCDAMPPDPVMDVAPRYFSDEAGRSSGWTITV